MIYALEGLPGDGKSYHAVVKYILPALASGRHVYTNIPLNSDNISKHLEKSPKFSSDLIHVFDDDDISSGRLFNCSDRFVADNSFLVIDELQNFHRSTDRDIGKSKKDSEDNLTKFVAEHRHHGLDILIISQDMKDVHNIWRRRINTKLRCMRLTKIGFPNHYAFSEYHNKGGDKFQRLKTNFGSYNSLYFPLYRSVSTEGVKTDLDDSQSFLRSNLFVKIVSFFLFFVLPIAIYKGYSFFKSPPVQVSSSDNLASHPSSSVVPSSPSFNSFSSSSDCDLYYHGAVSYNNNNYPILTNSDHDLLSFSYLVRLGYSISVYRDFVRILYSRGGKTLCDKYLPIVTRKPVKDSVAYSPTDNPFSKTEKTGVFDDK